MKKINYFRIIVLFFILNSPFFSRAQNLNELRVQIKEAFNQVASEESETKIQKLIESWLSLGGSVDMEPNEDSWTLMIKASGLGYYDLTKFLIDQKADPNKVTVDGLSPLILASNSNFPKVIRLLLENGAYLNQEMTQNKGVTALYLASQNGHEQVVNLLLAQEGIEINKVDFNGATPLYIASQFGHAKVVESLLKNKAEVDKENNSGITPYAIARSTGNLEIQELLSKAGADTTKRISYITSTMNKLGYNINEGGMCYGITFMAVQSFLRAEGFKFIARMKKIKNGEFNQAINRLLGKNKKNTPLVADKNHITAEEQEEFELKAFFDGISLYMSSDSLNLPGYPLTQNWKREFRIFNEEVKHERGSRKIFPAPLWLDDINMKAVILVNYPEKIQKIISWLLKQKRPIALPLVNLTHQVVLAKDSQGPLYLINHDKVIQIEANIESAVAIQEAIGSEGVFLAEILTNKNSPIDISEISKSLFYSSKDFRSDEMVTNEIAKQHNFLGKSLYLSSYTGYESLTTSILRSLDQNPRRLEVLNFASPIGYSSLSIASQNGHSKVVDKLLAQQGVDLNRTTTNGASSLYLAAQNGHVEIVRALLASEGIEVNQSLADGTTALMVACIEGHSKIVELLLAKEEIDVNMAMSIGATPLFMAAQFGYEKIVELLLTRKDIDVNKSVIGGATPLLIASQNGHGKIVSLLLAQEGIDIEKSLSYGKTPLLAAAQNGHDGIVRKILAAGGRARKKYLFDKLVKKHKISKKLLQCSFLYRVKGKKIKIERKITSKICGQCGLKSKKTGKNFFKCVDDLKGCSTVPIY